jgi:dTDP-4-amino-4,6-dideoxygalactose transaminase
MLPTFETVIGWSPRASLLNREDVRHSIQERDRNPVFPKEAGSDFSYQMLQRTDGADVRGRRRANYRRLAMAAASQPYLQPMVPSLPDGACPLGLPVLATNRDASRAHFLRRGINVRAYWERLPREVDPDVFPEAQQLSERILILPVHQSMTERQVDYVVKAIHELPAGAAR